MSKTIFLAGLLLQAVLSKSQDINSHFNVDVLKYEIGCPLRWVNYKSQARQLPYFAVSNTASTVTEVDGPNSATYIARTAIFGHYVIGTFQDGQSAYFYSDKDGSTVKKNKFELLTNPNNCSLQWAFLPFISSTYNLSRASDSSVVFEPRGKTDSYHVGRIQDFKNEWQLCNVIERSQKCIASNGVRRNVYGPDGIQVLHSFTRYLSYKISNVSFSKVEEILDVTIAGVDKILNKAEVDVMSSVSYGITTSKGKSSESSQTITTGSANNNAATTIGSSNNNEDSEDLDVSRDITVPPMTSVEACSTQTVPKLVIAFEASVEFYSDGVDATRVTEILVLENFPGPFEHIDGNLVKTVVRGEVRDVQGRISSTFNINPADVLDELSCPKMMRKLDVERRQRIADELASMTPKNIKTDEDLKKVIAKAYKTYGSWYSDEDTDGFK